MATYVYENPAVRYDVVVDADADMLADAALTRKLLELSKNESLPWSGWTLKTKHNCEGCNPSTDRGVQWSSWGVMG